MRAAQKYRENLRKVRIARLIIILLIPCAIGISTIIIAALFDGPDTNSSVINLDTYLYIIGGVGMLDAILMYIIRLCGRCNENFNRHKEEPLNIVCCGCCMIFDIAFIVIGIIVFAPLTVLIIKSHGMVLQLLQML